jgi:hypothetical protein
MVKTTTGAVDGPEDLKPEKAKKLSAEDKKVQNSIEVDDATWGRIVGQASIQQSTPADVVRHAVQMMYGQDNPSGAINSGQDSDPKLT